jgi:FlaA1/EpsC-like NDP-sugar epimerase
MKSLQDVNSAKSFPSLIAMPGCFRHKTQKYETEYKRDRQQIAQGVAVHYQPQHHLLKDRIILVTGASDGIGREAALTYSRYSASVILVGRKRNCAAWRRK